MVRKNRGTKWFVEPRNASTNETAIMDLVHECGASEDNIHRGKKDSSGAPHDVIEVDHAFITRLKANAEKFRLVFSIYAQAEGDRAMRRWTFEDKKCVRRTKKVALVRRALEDLAMTKTS